MPVLEFIAHTLRDAAEMAWAVWWALVLGFALSGIVQAWVPRRRIESAMGGAGARPVTIASLLGAASSSCSYAAVAIAKSLFQKGASAASAIAFQFASTNLVFELGLVIWVLLGWQFTLAEFVGGAVLIASSTVLLRLFISRRLEEEAREHALEADAGHQHESAVVESGGWRARLTSAESWSDVAHNFRNDWGMLWKEIAIGFLLAGAVAQIPASFFQKLFLAQAPAPLRLIENVIVGPLVAIATFVCSVGNVPLAAVLWSGGIGFGGVIAFIFADLLVVPILLIYRKYYGRRFAWRLIALMYVTIVIAAIVVDLSFSALGLIPATRPSHSQIFSPLGVDYRLFVNLLGLAVFASLFALTARRGATDPVCGMKIDRRRAIVVSDERGTNYFCSEHCAQSWRSGEAGAHGHSHAHGAA